MAMPAVRNAPAVSPPIAVRIRFMGDVLLSDVSQVISPFVSAGVARKTTPAVAPEPPRTTAHAAGSACAIEPLHSRSRNLRVHGDVRIVCHLRGSRGLSGRQRAAQYGSRDDGDGNLSHRVLFHLRA